MRVVGSSMLSAVRVTGSSMLSAVRVTGSGMLSAVRVSQHVTLDGLCSSTTPSPQGGPTHPPGRRINWFLGGSFAISQHPVDSSLLIYILTVTRALLG